MDLDLVIQGGPIAVSLDRIEATNLHLRAKDGEVRLQRVMVPLDGRLPTWALLDATNLDPAVHMERLFGPGMRAFAPSASRMDLKDFRAEYSRYDRKLTLSGALDFRRHAPTQGIALEPTGQVGYSPITLTLPRKPGEPLGFTGVIEFREINCNMPLSLPDSRWDKMVYGIRDCEEFLKTLRA